MQVYLVRPDSTRRFIYGPADLTDAEGDIEVRGAYDAEEAARWAVAIGLAVARGANVRRLP